ncbi:MAG TPA: AAA family ATPase [Nocardioidaceae bacterium]|nr:AAA family ATPase [Nocardioidaceae bacterium]
MSRAIRISLFGGVEISGCDTPVSTRALALLGYLVARPGIPQPRAHLAELLWPESDASQARTNLRRELHHLRAALGGTGALTVDQTTLCWRDVPDCVVDVREFARATADAATALAGGDRAEFERHSTAALRLHRGPFLPGCYDDWAVQARERLDRACIEMCDHGVGFWRGYGDPAAGLELARRRVGLAPLEEPGYRQLIALQRACGDRAGALATYHRCASVLEQELGVSPSAQTRRELDAVLAEPSHGIPPAEEPREDAGSSARPALVGREAERQLLLDAWKEAATGCRLVVVTGEAGVGKTRLVAEVAQAIRRQDGAVATARCFAATAGLAFAPVAQWLRAPHVRMAAARLEPHWRTEVARLAPAGEDAPDPGRAKIDAWQRLRFFEGLARAVVAVGRPMLLTVDDLQWCDKASLSWLSFLLSFAGTSPLLVLATARDDEPSGSDLAAPLRAMRGSGQATTVALSPLSRTDTVALADDVAGRRLAADEHALLHSASSGNPFYVIEAMREAAASAGRVQPADLRKVLARRLARLPEEHTNLLALASAVGRDFGLDLLTEAGDFDAATVVRLVDDLWQRRILDQRGAGYDFTHDLLREAAYDAVTPARRWLLHRRLAQALELLYTGRAVDDRQVAADLAEQYDRSGQPERALPFYDRAARQATSVFANAEAVRLCERSLDLVATMAASRQRDERELAVLEQLLPPLNAWRGYASKQLEDHERRCNRLGERLGLVPVQASASIALFTTTFVQGDILESHGWGERALLLSEECPDLAGQAHMTYAGSGLTLGKVEESSRHFALACSLSGESDSLPIGTRTEVHARAWWAHALWLLGDAEGSRSACEQAEQVARAIDHPYSLAVALAYAAVTRQMHGDLAALEPTLAELTRLCERYDFAYYRQWSVVLTGWLRGGPAGLRQAREGIARLEAEGSLARMPYWLWLVADLHRGGGDLAAARAVLDAAIAFAVQHDDLWWLPEVRRARAALGSRDGVLLR